MFPGFNGFGGGGKGSDSYKMRLAFALMNSRPSNNPYDYSAGLNQLSGALLGYAANRDAEKREDNKGKTYAEALKAMGPTEASQTGGFGPSMDGTPDAPVAASKGSPMAAAKIFAANPDTATQGFGLAMQDMQDKRQQAREDERWTRQVEREDQRWAMDDARFNQRTSDERAWREKMDRQNFDQQQQMARLHAGLTAGNRPLEAMPDPQNPGKFIYGRPTAGAPAMNPNMPNIPSGYTITPEGAMAPIPGGPADPNRPGAKPAFPEYAAKNAGYASRMVAAEENIKKLLEGEKDAQGNWVRQPYDPASLQDRFARGLPDFLESAVATDQGQQYMQAIRDWTRAKLRRESGAAIGATEENNEFRTYWPMPGEGADAIAQKASARRLAADNLIKESQGAYDQFYGKPGQGATPPRLPQQQTAANMPQPGAVMDGYRFRGGNPADPNSWEQVR